jgi:hypothetical protein
MEFSLKKIGVVFFERPLVSLRLRIIKRQQNIQKIQSASLS